MKYMQDHILDQERRHTPHELKDLDMTFTPQLTAIFYNQKYFFISITSQLVANATTLTAFSSFIEETHTLSQIRMHIKFYNHTLSLNLQIN